MRHLLLLCTTGCFATSSWFETNIEDVDGDGIVAERFGGEDCDDANPQIGSCDRDRDGFRSMAVGGEDCDDEDGTVSPAAPEVCNGVDDDCDGLIDEDDDDVQGALEIWRDQDGDGFGNGERLLTCAEQPPAGTSPLSTDCDDGRADVHPGASEFCDGTDRDCDGETHDVDALDAVSQRLVDADEDGWSVPTTLGPGCVLAGMIDAANAPADPDCDDSDPLTHPGAAEIWYDGIDQRCSGHPDDDQDGDGAPLAADCDDTDPAISPTAAELCDLIDNDCDGLIDDQDPGVLDPAFRYLFDGDGDTWGNAEIEGYFCIQDDLTGWVADWRIDCDDAIPAVNPDAPEVCDGVDNDCDGAADVNAIDAPERYLDADGDGFGNVVVFACAVEDGLSALPGDCDDGDPGAYPGAPETCYDNVLQDCDDPRLRTDCDLDGFDSVASGGTDCDDGNASVNPNADELCDGLDNDCDLAIDEGALDTEILYRDADGDGFGAEVPQQLCPTAGYVTVTGDCDDTRATTFPGAEEVCGDDLLQDCDVPQGKQDCDLDGAIDELLGGTDCDDTSQTVNPSAQEVCDGLDNDCDDLIDDNDPSVDLDTVTDWFDDTDGDGFGSDVLVAGSTCSGPVGGAPNADDCDDAVPTTYPGAPERCDSIDNDCDGAIDEGVPVDVPTFYLDADLDGFGNPEIASATGCAPPVEGSWLLDATDCNDGEPGVFPQAVEICDALDNDCDGLIDDEDTSGARELTPWYIDNDGDGVGQLNVALRQCATPPGHASVGGDCDDDDPQVQGFFTWYQDVDGDGFGDDSTALETCGQPAGYVLIAGDCDDGEPQISPQAPEVCDGIDNDCDTLTDDADTVAGAPAWYADEDRDFWGGAFVAVACERPPFTTSFPGDCDDENDQVSPSATERCDGIDNDCNDLTDDEESGFVEGQTTFYEDGDSDGVGAAALPGLHCDVPGASTVPGDCDDTTEAVRPGNPELCDDDLDNNCNGFTDAEDEDALDRQLWYLDEDEDGYGTTSMWACPADPFIAFDDGDCAPLDPHVHPGALEVCDGIDNNCAGGTDEGLLTTFYLDHDGDGVAGSSSLQACSSPGPDYLTTTGDCLDTDPEVYPGQTEVCNGVDDNCVAGVDEDLLTAFYVDNDDDGFGAAFSASQGACEAPVGWVANDQDCDDGSPVVRPGATEVCDGIDNNCDGLIDDGLTVPYYSDNDFDGFGDTQSYVGNYCPGEDLQAVTVDGDCDDNDPHTYPDAHEVCDDKDNNCDGTGDAALYVSYYDDNDSDGIGGEVDFMDCPGLPYLVVGGDCDDFDPDVGEPFPWYADNDTDSFGAGGAVEVACAPNDPSLVSNNRDCDDANPGSPVAQPYYDDTDGDGFGDPDAALFACGGPPTGYVSDDTDCNPSSPVVPRAGSTWTVGGSGDFTSIQAAVDEGLCPNSPTPTLLLEDPAYSEDLDLDGARVVLQGQGVEATLIQGSLTGGVVVELKDLSILGTTRPVMDTNAPYLERVHVDGPSGSGPLIRASAFGYDYQPQTDVVITVRGGVGIEAQRVHLERARLTAVEPSMALIHHDNPFGGPANVSIRASHLGGLVASDITSSGSGLNYLYNSTLAITGSSTPLLAAVAVEAPGGCDNPSTAWSPQPSCATDGTASGIQTWNPNLDPSLWDFHVNIASDAFLSNQILPPVSGDYDLTPAGLPQYWEVFHGVDCTVGTEDADGDGLDCLAEYAQGTSPALPDTDGDGNDDQLDSAPLDPFVL